MNRVLNGDKTVYHISANWNPADPVFEVLNTPTTRGKINFMNNIIIKTFNKFYFLCIINIIVYNCILFLKYLDCLKSVAFFF